MRGFSAPLLLILISGILIGSFFVYSKTVSSNNVQGISTESAETLKQGLQLSIVSGNSSWEMLKYLCKTEDECLENLDSGKRLDKMSGSPTELRDISLTPDDAWKEYSYLKVYVRSSLDLINSGFRVLSLGNVPGTLAKDIKSGSSSVGVVLIPIQPLFENFYKSATFSNR